jgi:hypothetical protein
MMTVYKQGIMVHNICICTVYVHVSQIDTFSTQGENSDFRIKSFNVYVVQGNLHTKHAI